MTDVIDQTDDATDKVEAPVGNYYGNASVWKQNGRYYYGIENYSGTYGVECSEAFYRAYVAEWGAA